MSAVEGQLKDIMRQKEINKAESKWKGELKSVVKREREKSKD